jgi:hypothetical protein
VKRHLLRVFAFLSLALCLLSAALWYWSHRAAEYLEHQTMFNAGGSRVGARSWRFCVDRGTARVGYSSYVFLGSGLVGVRPGWIHERQEPSWITQDDHGSVWHRLGFGFEVDNMRGERDAAIQFPLWFLEARDGEKK